MRKNIFRVLCVSLIMLAGFIFIEDGHSLEHPSYEIQARLNTKNMLSASEIVEFTNNSSKNIRELFFHIYANRQYSKKEQNFMMRYAGYFKVNPYPEGFESGKLHIEGIEQNGEELAFAIEGKDETLLKVDLKRELRPGQSIKIAIDFSVKIPHAYGRFGWHKNILKMSQWYPVLAVLSEDGWNKNPFYPFHRPFFSESANYSVRLTVPQSQVVVHSGYSEAETQNEDGSKTIDIKTEAPIREFTFAMSPDYKVVESIANNVKVKSYYLPGREYHGKEAAGIAHDVIKFYSEQFCDYPYREFSIVPVHLAYGGEQMSNLVFIDTRVYELPKFLKRYFDFMISHETGHQWFYNLVGMDEFQEMWLEEGVNSYFNLEYLENKYGRNAEVAQLPEWMEKYKWLLPNFSFRQARDFRYKIISRLKLDHAVVGKLSSFQEPSSIFSITYGKGSRVIGMLKDQIGDEVFARVFKRIFEEYRFKNLNQKDFIRVCEEESGKDLQSFFTQWLMTDKKLNYAIQEVRDNKITLVNKGTLVMAAEVEVEFEDGNKETFVWQGDKETEKVSLSGASRIKNVTIDPDQVLLDIDQTNNYWPRRINVKPVPIYLSLYEIPVVLPEDSYNLVFGPEMMGQGMGVKASLQKPYDQIFYMSTGYEIGEGLHKSTAGYQINNLFKSQLAAGFEISNRTDYDGDEDLVSGKAYLRQELWPARYGLADSNDHITLYLVRNRGVDGSLAMSSREDDRNTSYLKRNEAIVGTLLHLGRVGGYPDPSRGYSVDVMAESSGHFLGATQYFYRGSIDTSFYKPVTNKSTLAFRFKVAGGYPNDKNLFELGGMDGLRGYDRKTIRGSRALLGSIEYRFPIKEDIHMSFFDNIMGLEAVHGVVFFDAGQSWFKDIDESTLKKDVGLGLRFHMSLGSFLEKVVVRVDAAKAINDSSEDTQFWFGINQAF